MHALHISIVLVLSKNLIKRVVVGSMELLDRPMSKKSKSVEQVFIHAHSIFPPPPPPPYPHRSMLMTYAATENTEEKV